MQGGDLAFVQDLKMRESTFGRAVLSFWLADHLAAKMHDLAGLEGEVV